MNRGLRHKQQRSNRVRLKADAEFLLRKIATTGATVDDLWDEIAEMRVRLNPKPGVAAPIILTGYTKESKRHGNS